MSLSPDKNELVVLAQCPNQLEVFFFRWKDDKTGEVVRVELFHPGLRNTEEHCTPTANWANTKLTTERYKACVGATPMIEVRKQRSSGEAT